METNWEVQSMIAEAFFRENMYPEEFTGAESLGNLCGVKCCLILR